jgi:D-sedoheptulose 7-phosphate isomerase
MRKLIEQLISESIRTKEAVLKTAVPDIAKAAAALIDSLKKGKKVLIFGNGGSAADSQHIAAELVGRFKKERKPLAAVALTTNTSTISALANDYGYDATFARQVEALGEKGDTALAISTSGNSKNVIEAARKARSLGIRTIGLLGGDGGLLKKECDISIVVGSAETPRIQEAHIMIGHILCGLIEKELFS